MEPSQTSQFGSNGEKSFCLVINHDCEAHGTTDTEEVDRESSSTTASVINKIIGTRVSRSFTLDDEQSIEVEIITKPTLKQRWVVLVLACIIMFGLYYLIKIPASINEQLKHTMPQDGFEGKYQLLFTMAHVPGIVLPLFTGILVDKIGGRVCLVMLSTTCLIGQIISSFGIEAGSWPVSLTGRFVYGLGVEALFTTNQTFLATWFGVEELGLALGISSAFSYLGFLLSFVISPIAANKFSVGFAFWIGTILIGVSVVAATFAFVLDGNAERKYMTNQPRKKLSRTASIVEPADPETSQSDDGRRDSKEVERKRFQCSDFSLSFWLICLSGLLVYAVSRGFVDVASGLMLERNLFVDAPKDCMLQYHDQCASGYLAPAAGNQPKDKNDRTCPETKTHLSFAPPLPTCLHIAKEEESWNYHTYVFDPLDKTHVDCKDAFFAEACTQDYCMKQNKATEKAGLLMTVPYLVTIATAFIFGHYGVDIWGLRAEMICLAPALLTIAHGVLAFQLQTSLLPPLIIHGLGRALSVSALWPSIPLTVKSSVIGTAFGMFVCIENLGLAFVPLLIAFIYNNAGKYLPAVEVLLMGLSGAGVAVGIVLIYYDRNTGGRLQAKRFQVSEDNMNVREGQGEIPK